MGWPLPLRCLALALALSVLALLISLIKSVYGLMCLKQESG